MKNFFILWLSFFCFIIVIFSLVIVGLSFFWDFFWYCIDKSNVVIFFLVVVYNCLIEYVCVGVVEFCLGLGIDDWFIVDSKDDLWI